MSALSTEIDCCAKLAETVYSIQANIDSRPDEEENLEANDSLPECGMITLYSLNFS